MESSVVKQTSESSLYVYTGIQILSPSTSRKAISPKQRHSRDSLIFCIFFQPDEITPATHTRAHIREYHLERPSLISLHPLRRNRVGRGERVATLHRERLPKLATIGLSAVQFPRGTARCRKCRLPYLPSPTAQIKRRAKGDGSPCNWWRSSFLDSSVLGLSRNAPPLVLSRKFHHDRGPQYPSDILKLSVLCNLDERNIG